MTRLSVLLLSAVLLASCSDSDNGTTAPTNPSATESQPDQQTVVPTGDIVGQARVTILGDWSIRQAGSQCASLVTFASDGSYVSTELDEVITGEYLIDEDNDGLFIALNFLSDNQLPDCNGSTDSAAGEELVSFLLFTSENIMVFSSEPDGGGNVLEFNRAD